MSYMQFNSEQDFVDRFSHISVGQLKLRILPYNDFSAQATQELMDWKAWGFLIDLANGIAAVRPESLDGLLNSASLHCTIDEQLPWCFIVPDLVTDGVNAGWMFRNNVRYHCDRYLYQDVTEAGGPMAIDLTFEQDPSDADYLLTGANVSKNLMFRSQLTEQHYEQRVDADFKTNFAVTSPLEIEEHDGYLATLYPKYDSLTPEVQADLDDLIVVCVDPTLGYYPQFSVNGAVLGEHKDLELNKLKTMIPGNKQGKKVLILKDFNHASISITKNWLGFAHLEHTSVTVRLPQDAVIEDHKGQKTYYPESREDTGIYQIKAPYAHSNALGKKDDLLVKIADWDMAN